MRVSFPLPATTVTSDITATFCCHVHFLAGQQGADHWLDGNAGALTLSLDEAFELAGSQPSPSYGTVEWNRAMDRWSTSD